MRLFSLMTLCAFGMLIPLSSGALNICTMTFNSADEKQALQAAYASEPQVTFTELVPNNRDPLWMKKACDKQIACDVLAISGHFGGLFFGERIMPTLSLEEMSSLSCDGSCDRIFSQVKSVYLMGCNTLATKKADHRSMEEYLNVLVRDGFPLENAEKVAAARYAQFGESIEAKMRRIFPQAEVIFGFDSTSPLGKAAGPLLQKAFQRTSREEKNRRGASPQALAQAFKGYNFRLTQGSAPLDLQSSRMLRCDLQAAVPRPESLEQAFSSGRTRDFFDSALEMKNLAPLAAYLRSHPQSFDEFARVGREILQQVPSLLGLQKRVAEVFHKVGVTPPENYERGISQTFTSFLAGGLNYLRTEQLCDMAETTPELNLDPNWNLGPAHFQSFPGVLASCFQEPRGSGFKKLRLRNKTVTESCLTSQRDAGRDWYCLTNEKLELTLEACLFAANRNADSENADNMRWYCYDQLRAQKRLNQAQCLTISKSMNSLGNRIKSNWNCLNAMLF